MVGTLSIKKRRLRSEFYASPPRAASSRRHWVLPLFGAERLNFKPPASLICGTMAARPDEGGQIISEGCFARIPCPTPEMHSPKLPLLSSLRSNIRLQGALQKSVESRK